jgi:LuxR family maltose regulon positive regulatory protein
MQQYPLLQTKLYIPPVRPELVSRPHLIEQLDEGLRLGHRLTLVSAPAGFGKTTLVSAWVQQSQPPMRVAWLSLDGGDNDVVCFLTYLVGALQTVHDGLGETALAILRSPQPPPTELILTAIINEIAETSEDPSSGAGRSLVLVLEVGPVLTRKKGKFFETLNNMFR